MTSPLSFRSTSRAHIGGLVLGAMLSFGFATNAAAEPTFPEGLENHAGMKCIPTCLLCHSSPEGGTSTVRNAQAYLLATVAKGDQTQLATFANQDTDGDGMKDLPELQAGRDPFAAGDAPICSPNYGCGARIAKPAAPESDGSAVLVSIGAAISLALWQRRRSLAQRRK